MNKITYLTPHFAVTGALQPADFPEIAALGFRSVLSNLPDGESSKYPSASEEAELAKDAGMAFRHVPAIKSEVFSDRVVDGSGPGSGASWRARCWRIAPPVCARPLRGLPPQPAPSRLIVSSRR